MLKSKFFLKDKLFNKDKIEYLSGLIKNVYPEFNSNNFEKEVLKQFPKLELKERIYWIRENLKKNLPNDFETTLNIFLRSLSDTNESEDFIFSPFLDYIKAYGCNKRYLNKSLKTLGEFTKYFSAEFAIRSFINNFPEQTFKIMRNWSLSNNVSQRRTASEGLRSKLPWAKAINFDYKKGSELLDNLFYDRSRYVTRSVANHLNDISKINPDFVIQKLNEWVESKKQNNKEMDYIIQHSLRTSVKKAHPGTMEFLGYNLNPEIEINNFELKRNNITLNEYLEFSFDIIAQNDSNLVVDYKIIYPNPFNRYSEKVFKIKKIKMFKGDKYTIEKRHLFKKMTTKKLYTGTYKLKIQINGKIIHDNIFNINW